MGRTLTFNRDEIVEKAMHLFWEHGYQGTSVKMLESTLELRPGSIYYSFGNKDRLYSEALGLYAKQLKNELDSAIFHEGTLTEGLKQFLFNVAIPNGNSHPSRACMIVKTLSELADGGGKIAKKADGLLQAMEDYFVEILDSAKSRDEIVLSKDSRDIARRLQVLIIGIRGFAQRDNVHNQLPSMINDAIDGLIATP